MSKKKCPHCESGNKPVQRKSTGEWVHNFVRDVPRGQAYSHTVCINPPKEKKS